jgi:hypothetical protein
MAKGITPYFLGGYEDAPHVPVTKEFIWLDRNDYQTLIMRRGRGTTKYEPMAAAWDYEGGVMLDNAWRDAQPGRQFVTMNVEPIDARTAELFRMPGFITRRGLERRALEFAKGKKPEKAFVDLPTPKISKEAKRKATKQAAAPIKRKAAKTPEAVKKVPVDRRGAVGKACASLSPADAKAGKRLYYVIAYTNKAGEFAKVRLCFVTKERIKYAVIGYGFEAHESAYGWFTSKRKAEHLRAELRKSTGEKPFPGTEGHYRIIQPYEDKEAHAAATKRKPAKSQQPAKTKTRTKVIRPKAKLKRGAAKRTRAKRKGYDVEICNTSEQLFLQLSDARADAKKKGGVIRSRSTGQYVKRKG